MDIEIFSMAWVCEDTAPTKAFGKKQVKIMPQPIIVSGLETGHFQLRNSRN